ncbi:MAG: glycosyltransferase, partial [Sedimentibacter sp.]
KENSIIILDTLKLSLSAGSLLASKIMNIKTVGIVTDIAGMKQSAKPSLKERFASFFINRIVSYYDSFIVLTEQMNEIINRKNKPSILMEGLVDKDMILKSKENNDINGTKRVLYAGGLYSDYGLSSLIQGFMKLDAKDAELHLYGKGDMVEEIKSFAKIDKKIKYYGVTHNDVVVKAELEATLLVNPRPTKEEFTKYSFPSKNMEYMVSGTPVLTTALPGMPKEYHEYVYLIEDESAEGIHLKLKELLYNTSPNMLLDKGKRAKDFVLTKKNNIVQAQNIIEFIKTF